MNRKSTYLFFLLLAASLAGGCAKNEVTERNIPQSNLIAFSVTTSRAATATVNDMHVGFRVFATGSNVASTNNAWYTDGSNSIDGTNNHIYDGDQWRFDPQIAWPVPGDITKYPLNFYAWYPADIAFGSFTATPAATTVIRGSYTVAATAAQQEDLLAAKAVANTRPAQGMISMTFNHILSKINFGVVPGKGTTPYIIGLGLFNIGDTRTYDFVAGAWTSAQPDYDQAVNYDYYGSYYNNGSVATPWSPGTGSDEETAVPFYTSATTPKAADANLMLMPQSGDAWVPQKGAVPGVGDGGLIYIIYRMTANQPSIIGNPSPTGDEVGYAAAASHPDYAGSTTEAANYTGPLYVLAGFPLSDAGGEFTWAPGKGYTYNIGLGVAGSCNGYLMSDYYFTATGAVTDLPIRDGRVSGEKLNDGIIHVTLNVGQWEGQIAEP